MLVRRGVVVEERHDLPGRNRDANVARNRQAAHRTGDDLDLGLPGLEQFTGAVGRGAIDDTHLEARIIELAQALQGLAQRGRTAVGIDDNGETWIAHALPRPARGRPYWADLALESPARSSR